MCLPAPADAIQLASQQLTAASPVAAITAPPAPPAPTYDTKLTPQEEATFAAWRDRLPKRLQSDADYDLRGAWKDNAQTASNGHLPDTFKKPNHPTFSSESKYSTDSEPGGIWAKTKTGKWEFRATQFNVEKNPTLPDYFKRVEPDSVLVLPEKAKP